MQVVQSLGTGVRTLVAPLGRYELPGPPAGLTVPANSPPVLIMLRAYQRRRFNNTYVDLLESPRYAPVMQFLLDELYGEGDLARRDAHFLNLLPVIAPLLPPDLAASLTMIAELHRLSATLDADMARHIGVRSVNRRAYVTAWRATGRMDDRERQISLTIAINRAIDRSARSPLLSHSLRALRTPASMAGFADLHGMLERGFDAFRIMAGSEAFNAIIATRERALAAALFNATGRASRQQRELLRQLP